MKKTKALLWALVALLLAACASSATRGDDAQLAAAGPTSLDIEHFIDTIDTSQDISQLSLADCRILRNAFAARRGFPFRDAYLRGIYQTTTWYDSLLWVFDGDSTNFNPDYHYDDAKDWRDNYYLQLREGWMKYTPEQLDFIERLKAREAELLKHNFDVSAPNRVNVANLLNPAQLVDFSTDLQERLALNGFAIVPADHQQLFHVYEQNDYANMPNFVTTDLYLQLFHLYFDCLVRDVEQQRLCQMLTDLVHDMGVNIRYHWQSTRNEKLRQAGFRSDVFLTVAHHLLTGKTLGTADPRKSLVDSEAAKVMASDDAFSDFITDYQSVLFPYSLFRPRGHYTRNDSLQRYFRAMMWLQSVPFSLESPADVLCAAVLADDLNRNTPARAAYDKLNTVLTLLMGKPDNLSVVQVAEELKNSGFTVERLATDEQALETFRLRLNQMAEQQTRIRPKFAATSRNKVCLLPQRYQPDAEVLQEMVDYDNKPTQRALPQGLDVMAAMGVSSAEKLLMAEGQKWSGFEPALKKMKARMDSTDWQATVATQWLSALKTVTETSAEAPYFMQTAEWDKKALNSALSSWAELKHDAILYAKQPMGAECGGGGPPEPVVMAFVEPNVAFWQKAIALLNATESVLKQCSLLTEKAKNATNSLREQAEYLLNISQKELKGEVLSDNEYDHLKCIGAQFENISLDMIREPDQYLMGWSDVQGPDRNTALVADVYTANAQNNPDKSILYAAVGQADEIYVIVEIGGCLYLTRGAVLSYREFSRPLGQQRLNDEEWQLYLKDHPREGVPQWMNDILVPLKKNPMPNEKFFYSTGC